MINYHMLTVKAQQLTIDALALILCYEIRGILSKVTPLRNLPSGRCYIADAVRAFLYLYNSNLFWIFALLYFAIYNKLFYKLYQIVSIYFCIFKRKRNKLS